MFNFNMEKLKYTEIIEVPKKSIASLIGELGGVIGKLFKLNYF